MLCKPLFPEYDPDTENLFRRSDPDAWKSCTTLPASDGEITFSFKDNSEGNVTDMSVSVKWASEGIGVEYQAELGQLSYMHFDTAKYLLLLDSDGNGAYRVILMNYEQVFFAVSGVAGNPSPEIILQVIENFPKNLTSQPAVQTSPGGDRAFLLFATDADKGLDVYGLYRGDTGDPLHPEEELDVSDDLSNIQARLERQQTPEVLNVLLERWSSSNSEWVTATRKALPAGRLDVEPDAITGFATYIGGSDIRRFKLTNRGNDCLIIDGIKSIDSASRFSVESVKRASDEATLVDDLNPPWNLVLLPNRDNDLDKTIVVDIAFRPDEASKYQSQLTIEPTPILGDAVLKCTGTGREPIRFDPANLAFGQVVVDSTSSLEIHIYNDGDTAIEVSQISAPESPFQWAIPSVPVELKPGEPPLVISVEFTPRESLKASGSMTVESSAPGSPHTIHMDGEGISSVVVHDLFIRDNLSDDGTEPLQGGGISASPDIILRNEPLDDPQATLGSAEALNNGGLGQNPEFGQDNYLYLRVHNKGAEPSSGTAKLYWIRPTTLASPAAWNVINTVAIPAVDPGSVAVVGPVVWPSDAIPRPEHYCFVALIDADGEPPLDLAAVQTWTDFTNLIRDSNNAAWRNFNVVDLIPGAPLIEKFEIRGWPRTSLRSDLKLDLSQVPRSARVYLRVNPRLARPAQAENLHLVVERQDYRMYRAEPGRVCYLYSMPLQPSDRSMASLEFMVPHSNNSFGLHIAQEIGGREVGRITRSMTVGQYEFVGNKRTHELHQRGCIWEKSMLPRNQVPYHEIRRALNYGYNGCHYCLPAHDVG